MERKTFESERVFMTYNCHSAARREQLAMMDAGTFSEAGR